ncbi:hypothetical protein T10_5138 [Trichinella papuae]|uniref:Uncharacterized protein n=1 Tax=Trichinella papuae TaxID=268474 RepID=A0A0V1MRS0_9BILA|nr:hypothetical protein T10_5138 [Trichinella papuae]
MQCCNIRCYGTEVNATRQCGSVSSMSVTRHVALSMAEKQAFLTPHSSEAGETTDSIPYVWHVQLKLSQLVNPVVCAHFFEEQGKSSRLPLSKRRKLLH